MMNAAEYTCIEPDYVEKFFCDGSKCGGSICCYGWQQLLDDAALARYRSVKGTEGERIRAGLVYLEEADGGYYLYFMADGVKTYIDMYQSGTYYNLRLATEPSADLPGPAVSPVS